MNVDLYKRFFRDVEYRDHHDSLRPYTVLTVQGRQYPVEILYSASPVANYVESTASVRQSLYFSPDGDSHPQLESARRHPGLSPQRGGRRGLQGHARRSQRQRSHAQRTTLGGHAVGIGGIPHARHANLPASEQRKVFQTTPRGFRKVVLATGLAETGLTIDNITCVIDSGFETVSLYPSRFPSILASMRR